MKPMSIEAVKTATRGLVVCGSRDAEITGVSTDSRTTRKDDLFVALVGENFDGHNYIRAAIKRGACGAVYSRDIPIFPEDAERNFIKVNDTLVALGDMAKAYRRSLQATVVAVTGSNGKTTTKEMTRHLVEDKLATVASHASFNNFVGVPLTLFEAGAATRVLVLEMGTNRPGEISRLAEIAAPDVGVITNVGRTHLEGLGSIEGVARAKAELLHGISADGCAILNADDAAVMKMRAVADVKVLTFGIREEADVFASEVERTDSGFKFLLNGTARASLNFGGRHNIMNALAAVAVARRLGLELDYIAERLSSFKLPAMRLEERRIRGVTVINDAYNANPESMALAMEELAGRKGTRKLFVFADMLELGEGAVELHREVGREAARAGFDFCWATGELAQHSIEAAVEAGLPPGRARFFPEVSQLGKAVVLTVKAGDVLLLKASRGMKLERVLDSLK